MAIRNRTNWSSVWPRRVATTRSHADTFPPPVHGGSTLIWHLDDVLDWLSARGRYPVAETTLETVRLLRQLNLAREARHLKPDVVQILDTYLV